MKGIYYKEGIYVLIESDEEHNDCIYHYYNRRDALSLFGGRVGVDNGNSDNDADLTIDGISIINIWDKNKTNQLSLSQIVSHLNAIETNGVDAFLRNYKQSVEFFYEELKNLNQMTAELLSSTKEDLQIKNLLLELEKIRGLLLAVLIILFFLKANMASCLENEKVISVCQSIMESFA